MSAVNVAISGSSINYFASFARASALIRAAVDALIFPARSDRVAPLIASLWCVLSFIGKRLPLRANTELGILLRFLLSRTVIMTLRTEPVLPHRIPPRLYVISHPNIPQVHHRVSPSPNPPVLREPDRQ